MLRCRVYRKGQEGTWITEELIQKLTKLDDMARKRGQSLAQMSLVWVLRDARITSALIGASSVEQLKDSLKCLGNTTFSNEELQKIDNLMPLV